MYFKLYCYNSFMISSILLNSRQCKWVFVKKEMKVTGGLGLFNCALSS